MEYSIYLHVAGLSLLDTVSILDSFGVGRRRSTVHNWMRKAELQLEDGESPTHIAVDVTVIFLDNERDWVLAAVDPETNELPSVGIHPTCTVALTERFLRELREKHDVADTLFLVDGVQWLQAALHRYNLRF